MARRKRRAISLRGPVDDLAVYGAAERAGWLARAGMCISARKVYEGARRRARGMKLNRETVRELAVARLTVARCRRV